MKLKKHTIKNTKTVPIIDNEHLYNRMRVSFMRLMDFKQRGDPIDCLENFSCAMALYGDEGSMVGFKLLTEFDMGTIGVDLIPEPSGALPVVPCIKLVTNMRVEARVEGTDNIAEFCKLDAREVQDAANAAFIFLAEAGNSIAENKPTLFEGMGYARS